MLMPALMSKWSRVRDDERELFPMLECVSSVAQALHTGFLPYVQPVFERCVHLVRKNLDQTIVSSLLDYLVKDFCSCPSKTRPTSICPIVIS
jgi:hypothetical protein